ncbi:MAG: transposase [Promethearchaeota archaeon]
MLSVIKDVLDTILLLYYGFENSAEKIVKLMELLYFVELKRSSILKWVKIHEPEYCRKNNIVFHENSEISSGHFGADGTFPKLKFFSDHDLKDRFAEKKNGRALIISDRITGRELLCYLGRGEKQQEIEKIFLLFKKKLSAPSKSIVVDYKPAWNIAVKRVFSNIMIIRNGFHIVQLINRAILKELQKLTKKIYSIPIKET